MVSTPLRPGALAAALLVGLLGAPASAGPQEGEARPAAAPADAYERGLAWLRGRAVDGKWGPPGKADPGVTSLVVTAFLERPGGMGEEDAERVDAALDWLLSLQKEDGGIYEQGNANYTTSLAVQALALRGRPADLKAREKAVAFLRKMQFYEEGGEGRVVARGDLRYGGMGYGSDPTQPDLSNTQFTLESLRAAGVPATDPAFQRALVYLQRTQNRRENETAGEPAEKREEGGRVLVRSSDGGAPYRPFDSKAGNFERPDGKLEARSYGSMTYALLKCYVYAGLAADDGRLADAVKWVGRNYTWEENPGFTDPKLGQQGLYYYYATAAQALHLVERKGATLPAKARGWREDLGERLRSLQREDGSWVNENDRWMEGLPEIATSFALKALAAAGR